MVQQRMNPKHMLAKDLSNQGCSIIRLGRRKLSQNCCHSGGFAVCVNWPGLSHCCAEGEVKVPKVSQRPGSDMAWTAS